jgi:hypothetical protein
MLIQQLNLSAMKTISITRFSNLSKWAFLGLSLIVLSACSSDDNGPEPVDEEETITTMTVTLQGGGSTVTLVSEDLDGDGPNPPEITVSGPLQATTQYIGSIELLNATVNPPEDITEEIEEEDDEHQFFFAISGSIEQIGYLDEDGNGNPVGLSFSLSTGAAGDANLSITLRHEPKKPNDGTLSDAGGETDIAQSFSLQVE